MVGMVELQMSYTDGVGGSIGGVHAGTTKMAVIRVIVVE